MRPRSISNDDVGVTLSNRHEPFAAREQRLPPCLSLAWLLAAFGICEVWRCYLHGSYSLPLFRLRAVFFLSPSACLTRRRRRTRRATLSRSRTHGNRAPARRGTHLTHAELVAALVERRAPFVRKASTLCVMNSRSGSPSEWDRQIELAERPVARSDRSSNPATRRACTHHMRTPCRERTAVGTCRTGTLTVGGSVGRARRRAHPILGFQSRLRFRSTRWPRSTLRAEPSSAAEITRLPRCISCCTGPDDVVDRLGPLRIDRRLGLC